jgi:hypothetical protein
MTRWTDLTDKVQSAGEILTLVRSETSEGGGYSGFAPVFSGTAQYDHLEYNGTNWVNVVNLTMADDATIGAAAGGTVQFAAAGVGVWLEDAGDFVWYSDAGVTEKARVDGGTGNITTSGTVDGVSLAEFNQATFFVQTSSAYMGNEVVLESFAPTWTGRHQWSNSVNALAGLSDRANYHATFYNPANDLNEGVGLGFYISAADNDIGAAIVHKRTDTNSKGTLQFYTKIETGDATAPALALTLGDDGVGTFEKGVEINAGGIDSDTVIQGLSDTNLLHVDAANDTVIISNSTVDGNVASALQVIDANMLISRGDAHAALQMYTYGGYSPYISARAAGGNRGTPSATPSGETLLRIGGGGHTGSAYTTENTAWVQFEATEAFDGSGYGSRIKFATTPNNSTSAVIRGYILEDGDWVVGNYQAADGKLHVYDSGATSVVIESSDSGGAPKVSFRNATAPSGQTWTVGINASNYYQIRDNTAAGNRIVIDTSGNVGVGTSTPGSLMEWNFANDNLEFVDADNTATGVSGVTAVIECQIGGATCYVPAYTSYS